MARQNIPVEQRMELMREIAECIKYEYQQEKGYLKDNEIAEIIGYSSETVRNLTNEAVSLGYLSEEVANERRREKRSERGRNCSACQRILTPDKELGVLMSYLYDDRINDKIMHDLGISQKVYHTTIKRCVNYGLISQEEYKTREHQRRSNGRIGKSTSLIVKITEDKKNKLKELLEQGITYREIEQRLGINDADYWAKRFGHKRSNKRTLSQEEKEILILANEEGYDARKASELIYETVNENDLERVRRFWKKERLPINQSERYVTNKLIEDMCEAYDSGFNVTEISKLLDISDNSVSKYLRSKGYDTTVDLSEEQVELALEVHQRDMTLREAAESIGISATSIGRIWKRNGLLPNHLGIFGADSQCIAEDGHICHSRSEKTIDDLFLVNDIPHEKPSNFTQNGTYYEDSSMTPDWIIDRIIYVEFAGLYNSNNNFPIIQNYVARVDSKMQQLIRRNIPFVFIFPKDDLETKVREILDLIEKQRRAA